MHACRTIVASNTFSASNHLLQALYGCTCSAIASRRVAASYRKEPSPIESSDSVFASYDPVQRQAAIDLYTQAYKLRHNNQRQLSFGQRFHVHLPDSKVIVQYCPLLASAVLVLAGPLLLAPQQALQMLAGFVGSPPAAVGSLGACFAQFMGASYIFQAAVTLLAWDCVSRGELGATACQRMLMATLLPVPGVLLSLNKAASSCNSLTGLAVIAVLELSMFAVHVLLHLHHHPWFLLKVFWPLVTTMLMTELIPNNWTFSDAGLSSVQAVLTALISVKLFGPLSRIMARFAPALCSWLAKYALPRFASGLSNILPRVASYVGRLIPRLTRLGARLAGRIAPRYAQDQVVGQTQQWAFPEADGLLTDTVAKSVDLLPPKNPASWAYCGLLATQLMMVFGAYAPDLLFSSAAVAVAALAPASLAADAAAETAAVVNGTAAALAAVLRFIKFSWGSGFFVSAFACNCLKTAADRGHLWKTANRQLNLAMVFLQTASAVILLIGMEAGAVLSNAYAWFLMTAAVAGALFCCMQAAAAGLQQGQALSLAGIAIGSWTPSGSRASAFGSVHVQQSEQQGTMPSGTYSNAMAGTTVSTGGKASNLAELIPEDVIAILEQQAAARETPSQLRQLSQLQLSRLPDHLLSSVDWETREHRDPNYAAVLSATCILLTLLQLAL